MGENECLKRPSLNSLNTLLKRASHVSCQPPDLIMRYVAAALLCAMGENEISAANMEKILSSVGVEADKERLSQVVAACKGKSTEELIAASLPKLASMGGGGGAAPAAAAAGAAAPAAAAEAAPKKEEKKGEAVEEVGFIGLGLFD